jgi:anaerobic selenocysteine-containing dehydrogenase
MIRRILESGRADRAFLERHASGHEQWKVLAEGLDPARVARITDVPVSQIERLADEFAAADGAFATSRVGVQTSHNTTLTEWAVMTLNAITGNIDRPGGVYFNPGAIDVPALIERFSKRRNAAPSRIGSYPQIFGGPPAPVFADDVLSDDPDRIRALVVVAGNPVITFPNTEKVERALRKLELLVCVDIYPSDTIAFSDYALPAATLYEKGGLHFLTSTFEPYPFLEWRSKILEPRGESKSEWEIFKALSRSSGVPFLNDPLLDRVARVFDAVGVGFSEDALYRFLLLGKSSLRRLKRAPGGIKLGDIRFGELLDRGLRTPDGRLHLAPADLVKALPEALAEPPLSTEEYPLLLVSGARRLAGYNSWTHHIAPLTEKLGGNWATLNPADAERLGIAEGQRVQVRSGLGELEIEARISTDIREGVVAIHQFFGHVYDSGTAASRRFPGVNVNLLHDDQVRDRFCGMPVFNGTPCRVAPLDAAASERSS